MQNKKVTWNNLKRILPHCGFILLLLNLLYFSFFFNRSYEYVSVQTELTVSNPTKVWYVYKNMYSEKRLFSERQMLSPNKLHEFVFNIESNKEIDYLGLFWEAEKGSSIKVSSYSYSIDNKSFRSNKVWKIIHYISKGSLIETIDNSVKVQSTNSNRNWIMLDDTTILNGRRDYKEHSFIPLIVNIVITLSVLLLLLFTPNTKPENLIKNNLSLLNIKITLLLIWVFIMPFWIIVSHTLMISIVVLTFLHGYYNKVLPELFIQIKRHYLFYILYIWIIVSSLVSSPSSQILDNILDYSYLLLMPIVFSQIENKSLERVLYYFKKGLLVYFFLLLIFATSNYFELKPDYSYIKFFELNLELFWHTTYISSLILIVFISEVRSPIKNNFPLVIFYITALLFMYLVNARIPFIVGLLLIGIKAYPYFEKRLVKIGFIILIISISLGCVIFFLTKEPIKNNQNINNVGDINNIDARLSIWKSSISEIKNNFVFGVGGTNTVDVISNSIDEKVNTKFRNYNSHNQFLEIFLSHGFLAFILLLWIFYRLYKTNGIYAKSFVFSSIILFLVESHLQRQAGIIFFTFWYCFFFNFNNTNDGEYIK